MPGFALALIVPAALAAIPAATVSAGARDTSEIDLVAGRADASDRMTVPVRIGDKGPYRFLIDTGSQRTVLSTDLAARLALEAGRQQRVVSVAGTQIAQTALLDELSLGTRTFRGLSVVLFAGHDIGADGIVGVDSLQSQRVLIDFDRNTMAIGDARALGGNTGFDIVVTARRRSGQLIMTHAQIDGVRTDVVIDTGAEISIGNRALERALGRTIETHGQGMLASVTGLKVPADIGVSKTLEIGSISINRVLIAYADTQAFAALGLGKRPALLLGMRDLRLFKRVAIDFPARKVMFDLPPAF